MAVLTIPGDVSVVVTTVNYLDAKILQIYPGPRIDLHGQPKQSLMQKNV